MDENKPAVAHLKPKRSGPSGWKKWRTKKHSAVETAKEILEAESSKPIWTDKYNLQIGGRCLNFGVRRVELSSEQRSVGVQTEMETGQ